MKIKGEVVSRNSLMEIFGWSHAKVDRLLALGMPVIQVGGFNRDGSPRPWKLDTARCAKFAKKHAYQKGCEKKAVREAGEFLKQLHPDDPRHRFVTGQAQRLEQLHHRESGETLTKEDAVEIVDTIFGMLREHFGKLPSAIVSQLDATGQKADKVERLLKREVTSALSGMDAREIAEVQHSETSEFI